MAKIHEKTQKRGGGGKPTSSNYPFPLPPPTRTSLVSVALRKTHQREEFITFFFFFFFLSLRSVCVRRGGCQLIPSGASFKAPALRASCYTCLPSCGADGRGWDRCPNLCFCLPGKVGGKSTKAPGTLRTSHHGASVASYKDFAPQFAPSREEFGLTQAV